MAHNDTLNPSLERGLAGSGPERLSAHEREVLARAARGATDKEIADATGLSVAALRSVWIRIRDRLGAVNRTHAIALAAGDGPAPESSDFRSRLTESLVRDRVASWVWRPRPGHALLDPHGARQFGLPEGDAPVPLDRLLAHIWSPDRSRFERFLRQSADLRPMTPIELRVGTPGDYRQLIRTVNLATTPGAEGTTLLASTTIHVFPP